jgi:hypothetical protein
VQAKNQSIGAATPVNIYVLELEQIKRDEFEVCWMVGEFRSAARQYF